MNQPNSAAIYCRISQDRSGAHLGVDRQQQDCQRWADQHGWTTGRIYIDNDISAYSGKQRPGYRQLLKDLEAGDRDGLVIWHPDRLHRSPAELENFIALVERTAVPIGTVTAGDVDLTTATGRMTARIVGAVARGESDHKRERIRRKHVELAQNGKVPGGGIRPFGFQEDRRTLEPAEAEEIRAAAARILAGEPIRRITNDWRRREVPTVTGAQWSSTTVKRLLRSGRIAGLREHHGQTTEAEWPAIISSQDHKRIRAILDDPGRTFPINGAPQSYLLSGFVYCDDCGARLTARPIRRKGIRYRRYHCITDRGGCNHVGIAAQPLEDLVTRALIARLETPDLANQIKQASSSAGTDATEAELELDDLQNRGTELAAMFADGDITRAEWAAAKQRLEQRSTLATKRLAGAATRLNATPELATAWTELNTDQRRAALKLLIGKIRITRTAKANNRFDPARVLIDWIA